MDQGNKPVEVDVQWHKMRGPTTPRGRLHVLGPMPASAKLCLSPHQGCPHSAVDFSCAHQSRGSWMKLVPPILYIPLTSISDHDSTSFHSREISIHISRVTLQRRHAPPCTQRQGHRLPSMAHLPYPICLSIPCFGIAVSKWRGFYGLAENDSTRGESR